MKYVQQQLYDDRYCTARNNIVNNINTKKCSSSILIIQKMNNIYNNNLVFIVLVFISCIIISSIKEVIPVLVPVVVVVQAWTLNNIQTSNIIHRNFFNNIPVVPVSSFQQSFYNNNPRQQQQQQQQQQHQCHTFSSTRRGSNSIICTNMIGRSSTSDLDIVFGSDATSNVSGGVSWGEEEEDEDDDNINERRDINHNYDTDTESTSSTTDTTTSTTSTNSKNSNTFNNIQQNERYNIIQKLFNEQDNDIKLERKQKLWGIYANITNHTEFTLLYEQEQLNQKNNFIQQQQIALSQGIILEILDPIDNDLIDDNDSTTTSNNNNNTSSSSLISSLQTSNGKQQSKWYSEMDDELKSEWEQLTSKDKVIETSTVIGEDDDDDDDDDDNNDDNDSQKSIKQSIGTKNKGTKSTKDIPTDTTATDTSREDNDKSKDNTNNKNPTTIATKNRQQAAVSGIRVGSVGGWTLEVFPGDYIVHRKYGIGKFEKTCLKSKTRLSPTEKVAQEQRRAQILSTELRNLQLQKSNTSTSTKSTSKKKQSISTDDIQSIRSKFGTIEDTDPISNPQTTVFEILYKDAIVHVPIDRAYRLSRYRAGDSYIKPKLSRVKGEAWIKTRSSVEQSTIALAQDVLALYAKRETLQRQPFHPDKEIDVKQFEQTFPFTPTPDQNKCFDDIENDMVWRSRPMDRLICGDVGFGKTEVAIRALYRAVVNGRQCALLSPTGVLAAQHYKTILKRMGPSTPYNITCTLLRGGMGKKTKSGKEIREQIASGNIQLIVGTHALLGNDLQFNDLGLLVVDEEQRFGVKQKERLKLISNGVDVLTLSATPIPRTLQMSLSGVRDTSTIRSPPPMRKPVVTYVQDFNEELIYTAISTELNRGGQAYYVVPRISMLDEAQAILIKLFPNIRIIQAHGRMLRNGAEENVAAFAEGTADVLLATTVIENGVDIPSVNTIIVQNSQAFGMSTLYQLRGRVGRSDQQAYAYFLHREESITEQAALRLQAIGELNELGSGFDVANRDLEIRGAGSLLGTEQSGLASKVGFDLYMRLLKKSIRKLRGLDIPTVPRTNIITPLDITELDDTTTDDDTATTTAVATIIEQYKSNSFTIPISYIGNNTIRTSEESKARLAESTSKLVDITNEWKTLYGPVPAIIQKQLKTMHLHVCTRRLGIDLIGLLDTGIPLDDNNDNSKTRHDLILRSPGLRPRHWATIVSSLPKQAMPKGFDVMFPSRFARYGEEIIIEGGKRVDIDLLISDAAMSSSSTDLNNEDENSSGTGNINNNDNDEEDWDALDQEDVESMTDTISIANSIRNINEIDIEQYSRFVFINGGTNIDRVLKFLLPITKIVYEYQIYQINNAKSASELRERQEIIKQRKKNNIISDSLLKR